MHPTTNNIPTLAAHHFAMHAKVHSEHSPSHPLRSLFPCPTPVVCFLHRAGGASTAAVGTPFAAQFNGHVFAIVDGTPDVNRYIVFRGNTAASNGGFFIGGSSDVLVEKNEVSNTPNQSVSGTGHYYVSPKAQGVYLVGNH